MASIGSLAPETLCKIFDLLALDTVTLLSASLVARKWQDPAQRTLFGHLDFTKLSRDPGWAESKINAWLASDVREVHFVHSVSINASHAAAVLPECWEITELEITSVNDGDCWDVLDQMSMTELRRLTVHFPDAFIDPVSRPDRVLPFRLTHLRLNPIQGPRPGSPASPPSTAFLTALLQPSLTSLSLTTFGPADPTSFLSDFLPALAPTLLHLGFDLSPLPTVLLSLLPLCTALESLTVAHALAYPSASFQTLVNALPSVSRLKSVMFAHTVHPEQAALDAFAVALGGEPLSMRSGEVRESFGEVAGFVTSPKLGMVREVKFEGVGEEEVGSEEWRMMCDACRQADIAVWAGDKAFVVIKQVEVAPQPKEEVRTGEEVNSAPNEDADVDDPSDSHNFLHTNQPRPTPPPPARTWTDIALSIPRALWPTVVQEPISGMFDRPERPLTLQNQVHLSAMFGGLGQ